MEYTEAIRKIGRDDVSVTFGIAPPEEVVGPLKPKSVHYGLAFGYDERVEKFQLQRPIPMLTFAFNKYRSDLPPWRNTHEVVLASMHGGEPCEATFIATSLRTISTTGDLKTVTIHAEGPSRGVDAHIISREAVTG